MCRAQRAFSRKYCKVAAHQLKAVGTARVNDLGAKSILRQGDARAARSGARIARRARPNASEQRVSKLNVEVRHPVLRAQAGYFMSGGRPLLLYRACGQKGGKSNFCKGLRSNMATTFLALNS